MKIKVGARLAGFGKLGRWSIVCAAAILAMALFGCASRVAKPVSGELPLIVSRLKGQARWKTGTNDWQPLVKNQTVHAGMEIETAQNSHVDLQIPTPPTRAQSAETASSLNRTDLRETKEVSLNPQSMIPTRHQLLVLGPPNAAHIRLWDNTHVAFPRLKRSEAKWRKIELEQATVDLLAGHMLLALEKFPTNAQFQIITPVLTASIPASNRGTILDINVDGIVKVLCGSVNVKGTNFSQTVSDQQMFDARTKVLSPLLQCDGTKYVLQD